MPSSFLTALEILPTQVLHVTLSTAYVACIGVMSAACLSALQDEPGHAIADTTPPARIPSAKPTARIALRPLIAVLLTFSACDASAARRRVRGAARTISGSGIVRDN